MHTSSLQPTSLTIEIAGAATDLESLLPAFGERDRIGVVVSEPCGGVGASLLMLAAAAAFYRDREGGEVFPDHYVFHVGQRHGDHAALDVWPPHKEVVVDGGPQALLEAINDRAITRLAVPAAPRRRGEAPPPLPPWAVDSARRRLAGAFAYAPSGRVDGGDVRVGGDEATEGWAREAIEQSPVPETACAAATAAREALLERGRPVETYRRVPVADALAVLAAIG